MQMVATVSAYRVLLILAFCRHVIIEVLRRHTAVEIVSDVYLEGGVESFNPDTEVNQRLSFLLDLHRAAANNVIKSLAASSLVIHLCIRVSKRSELSIQPHMS
eukprot:767026-Hanusia_phi.AAC.2